LATTDEIEALVLNSSDNQFRANWPANTTPQAPDASGAVSVSLCGFGLTNTAAAARFVKFYDKATAPVVGTDAPKRTIEVGAGLSLYAEFSRGKLFKLGMWVSVTVNAADADNTAPAAGDVLMTVDWQ
jgi:hypothetical protein